MFFICNNGLLQKDTIFVTRIGKAEYMSLLLYKGRGKASALLICWRHLEVESNTY